MAQRKRQMIGSGLGVLLLAQACAGQGASGHDGPGIDSPDTASEEHTSPPPSARSATVTIEDKLKASGLPDTPAAREILDYLIATRTPNSEATTRAMAEAKAVLQRHARASVSTLTAAYDALPEEQYATRENLVFVLGELESSEALDGLARIMKSQLPPERNSLAGEHREYATRNEERKIRSLAIEGVARLARNGDPAATLALREMVEPGRDRILRWTSIEQSLRMSGDPLSKSALMSQLDETDRAIFQTRLAMSADQALRPDITAIARPSLTPIDDLDQTVAELPCRDCNDDPGSPPAGPAPKPVVCGVWRQDYGADDLEIVGANGWNCRADWINYWWGAYDYDSEDWAGDWGYYNGCDTRAPLARAFNANWLINQVGWFSDYAPNQIDELDPSCATDASATTVWGPVIDNYPELKIGFFYNMDPISRASVIVHEARHAAWQGHTASDDACAAGGSCDTYYGDDGANSYQIDFLINYAANAANPLGFRWQAVTHARIVSWAYFELPEFSPQIPNPT